MVELQRSGCHNINFVTPTHVVPQIIGALLIAIEKGLCIPLVYNTGGYDSVETLQLLDGIIDIYMPDIKYSSGEAAKRLSKAEDYPEVAKSAIIEMHRQVGDLLVEKGRPLFPSYLTIDWGRYAELFAYPLPGHKRMF